MLFFGSGPTTAALCSTDDHAIEVHKTVAARPPAVFKTVTDIKNWPRIIGSVTAIELLTRGRVRVGTRVRLIRIMYGRQMTEELEVETFERPRGLRLV